MRGKATSSGERLWGYPARIEDPIHEIPGGLGAYAPRFGFRLLEEVRLAESADPERRNLAAAVFRLEASRALLKRQLELKFGPLPPAALQRLDEADADQLFQWADRVVAATTLDEVFGRY